MDEKKKIARLIIYTRDFRIEGYVKLRPMKIVDKTMYPRRISDIINMASERMALAGEPDFLELGQADMKDLKTGEVFKAIRNLAIRKSAVTFVFPAAYLPKSEESH